MGQAARKYAGDVTVFSANAISQLGVFRNVTLQLDMTTQENRAAQDAWEYPVGRIQAWSLDFSKCVEDEITGESLVAGFGTSVAVAFTSDGTAGIVMTGTGLVTKVHHQVQDTDGQIQDVMIVGQGAPTISFN